jgi:ethanolaminephosphotransferase
VTVVSATFPSFESTGSSKNCHEITNSVGELACQWRDLAERSGKLVDDSEGKEKWYKDMTKVKTSIFRAKCASLTITSGSKELKD